MRNAKADGGPAFPRFDNQDVHGKVTVGMSLREYTAIHASEKDVETTIDHLITGMEDQFSRLEHHEKRAVARYAFADAMIKARGRA